jgi:hypothetical protein
VNCDGTPSGKTADVEAGYIMGWNRSSANGGGKFVLANAKEADTDSPSGQFTPFRAFLATEYQTLPTDQNGNPAKFFMMAWDGDTSTATDIRGIVNVVDGDTYYNINGQRVEKPTAKGLYIHNGKKVLVK